MEPTATPVTYQSPYPPFPPPLFNSTLSNATKSRPSGAHLRTKTHLQHIATNA